MPLFLVFGVAVPPWCRRAEVFWKLVRDVKDVWRPLHDAANVGVDYPMVYCLGLQPGGSCTCHLTMLICLTMFDLRPSYLHKCKRVLKRYFRERLYESDVPCGEWFRMYVNDWCLLESCKVGRFVVSSEAVRAICGWETCTGMRYANVIYGDEYSL